MVSRKNRSQSKKLVYRRAPSGRVVSVYKGGRAKPAKCGACGALLGGIKSARRASKSERVPSRPFAGQLCGACVRGLVKAKARVRAGAAKPEDYRFAQRELMESVKKI